MRVYILKDVFYDKSYGEYGPFVTTSLIGIYSTIEKANARLHEFVELIRADDESPDIYIYEDDLRVEYVYDEDLEGECTILEAELDTDISNKRKEQHDL